MDGFKQTDIGLIPEDWELVTLEDIANINMGQSPASSSYNSAGIGIPFYQGKTDFGFVNPIKRIYCSAPSKYADEDDILISVRAPVGPVNIATEKCCIGRGVASIKPKPFTDRAFLYFYLIYQEARIAAKGTGSTFKAITKNQLVGFPTPKLNQAEQENIGCILSIIQSSIQKHEQIISTTTELKNALMKKLFTEGMNNEPQKETEIGLMPASWEAVPLGKYAFIENGFAFKSEDYCKTGVPLVRISNVSHGYLIDKDLVFLPEEFLVKYPNFTLKENDLIISLTRPITSGGLKYCFIESKHLPVFLNQRVGRFQIKSADKLTKGFLYHLIFSEYFIGELVKLFGSSSQQPNVSPTQLEKFIVPIPPVEQQDEIANALFLLNRKIAIRKKKKQSLQSLFHSILNQLMTGNIRVKDLIKPVISESQIINN